jgi:uncharacterized protein involved in outer membrane biogenesis
MRKRIERALGLLIIALAVLFTAFYLYVATMGQLILTKELETLTNRKVTIGYFSIEPNLRLEIKDLEIQGLAKLKSVSASPSIFGLLKGKLILNQLILSNPEFFLIKAPNEVAEVQTSTPVIVSSVAVDLPKARKSGSIPFGITEFKISNGDITFIDQNVSSGSLKITVKEINANVKNLNFYPNSKNIEFDFKAVIPWGEKEEQGKIELSGWLNPFKKDIRAGLGINGIDAVYLYPYYSYWVDLDEARIDKAKLNFSSDIHGLNNNVTLDCHIELSDIVRKPLEIGESEQKASQVTNIVLDRFKALDNGKVELNFAIKTKMDSPQLGLDNFRMAFEDKIIRGRSVSGFKLQDTIRFPVKMVEGGARSFMDLSRAMVDGIFAIGDELKDSSKEIFKPEEEQKEDNKLGF